MKTSGTASRSLSVRLALLALALAALSGCQRPSGGTVPLKQTAPAVGFPVAVRDALGEQVVMKAHPRRIISLAPAVTEILFSLGLGEHVVGVTEDCTYPPEAREKEKVGRFFALSVEGVRRIENVFRSRGEKRCLWGVAPSRKS